MPRIRIAGALVAILGMWFALGTLTPAVAAEVQTSNRAVVMADPLSVVFQLRVTAPGGLRAAVVNYRVLNPGGNVGGSVRPEVNASTTQDLRATLLTNNGERYIPVGSQFVYWWELTDADGTVHTMPEEAFTFLDGRYQWRERSEGDVMVFWYGNSDQQALLALQATADAISDMEALLQVQMPYPVRVVVYRSESEGELAQRPRGGAFDSQVVTGGARVATDLLHIYDSLGGFVDVARHEAAHLVTKVAGDGPFTTIPSWLDEGVAVYAQNDPGAGYRSAVQTAISMDRTLRLRSLAGPVNEASLINVFYGQSWAVVKFMVDTYGEAAFAEVFRIVKAGQPIDAALTEVYGLNQDSLYNAWRESVGLPAIDFSLVPDATTVPQLEGTRAPLGIPTSVAGGGSTPAPSGGETATATPAAGGSSNAVTAAIIGAVTLLLAGGLGGVGFRMLRKR